MFLWSNEHITPQRKRGLSPPLVNLRPSLGVSDSRSVSGIRAKNLAAIGANRFYKDNLLVLLLLLDAGMLRLLLPNTEDRMGCSWSNNIAHVLNKSSLFCK